MSEPRALVEHFFRHEFGRLVAVLTRSLGVRRLALVEDVVQAALVQALETWSRRGVPEDPAGWLYRTARNLAIDALRRERTHAQALPRLAEDAERELSPLEAHFADEIGDEPLRLLFVCCHEAVPAESRVALALKTLCGFSTAEIARALLTTEANVQKRIERFRLGRHSAAERAWREALRLTTARADREFLRRRLAVCRPDGGESRALTSPRGLGTQLKRVGLPEHLTRHLVTMADLNRAGRYDRLADGDERVTGRPAMSVREFVSLHADEFRRSSIVKLRHAEQHAAADGGRPCGFSA
jgi:RNA polymerase sigma factor (sigma-70 family)